MLGAGCADPRAGEWVVRFEDPSLRPRARIVEARILEGGCDGTIEFYRASIDVGGAGAMRPPVLEEGRYGLAARARDGECAWFADGCLDVMLPLGEGARATT